MSGAGIAGRSRHGWKLWMGIAGLVLLVAFLAPPVFHDTGIAKNESTAVGSLRKINELENEYAASHPDSGFSCQLEQLRPTEDEADVYGNPMKLSTGKWAGYKFEIVGCAPEKNGVSTRYQVTAAPLRPWASGVRAFCTDQSGKLYYDHNGLAAECLTSKQLLP